MQDNQNLASETLSIDRKKFYLDLRENARGRVLKITEDVGGRRDTVMVPAPALRELIEALQRIAEYEQTLAEFPGAEA
jgi:hypothetical protein